MYRAKEAGRNTYQFYSARHERPRGRTAGAETGLRRALERRELVRITSHWWICARRVVAVEALLRWNQPQLGLVQPAEFIPLPEEHRHDVPVGDMGHHDRHPEATRRWEDRRA